MSERERISVVEPSGIRLGRWCIAGSWWQQWSEWFTPDWNWRNFTLLRLDCEAGAYKGRYAEFSFGLLGLRASLEIYDAIDRAGELSPIERKLQDLEEGGDTP